MSYFSFFFVKYEIVENLVGKIKVSWLFGILEQKCPFIFWQVLDKHIWAKILMMWQLNFYDLTISQDFLKVFSHNLYVYKIRLQNQVDLSVTKLNNVKQYCCYDHFTAAGHVCNSSFWPGLEWEEFSSLICKKCYS